MSNELKVTKENMMVLPVMTMGLFSLSRGSFGLIVPHILWFLILAAMMVLTIIICYKGGLNISPMTGLLVVAMLLVFHNNWDFKNGIFADAYYYCIIIFLAVVSQKYVQWQKALLILIVGLGVFYAIWTYICGVNEGIYFNYVFPFLRSVDPTAPRGNFTFGITTHYSTNGMYLALALMATLSINLIQKKQDKHRVFYLFLSLFLAGGVLLSGKRGIVIVAVLSFSFVYILKKRNINRPAKLIALLLVALIMAFFASFWIPALRIIVERFEIQIAAKNVASDRFELWSQGFRGFLNSPVFGNGWDWFRYHNSFGVIYHVHNCYIQWICELGVMLSLPLYIMVFYGYYRAFKLYRSVVTRRKSVYAGDEFVNVIITFAFMYETYFLAFMFEGTGYYEIQSSFVYFMCLSIVEYYIRNIRSGNRRSK